VHQNLNGNCPEFIQRLIKYSVVKQLQNLQFIKWMRWSSWSWSYGSYII